MKYCGVYIVKQERVSLFLTLNNFLSQVVVGKNRVETLLTCLSTCLSICSVCQHSCSLSNTRLLSETVEPLILSKSDKGAGVSISFVI